MEPGISEMGLKFMHFFFLKKILYNQKEEMFTITSASSSISENWGLKRLVLV